MPRFADHLGCQVGNGTTEAGCSVSLMADFSLAQSKVNQDDVAHDVQKDVLRFEVAVYDITGVEVL